RLFAGHRDTVLRRRSRLDRRRIEPMAAFSSGEHGWMVSSSASRHLHGCAETVRAEHDTDSRRHAFHARIALRSRDQSDGGLGLWRSLGIARRRFYGAVASERFCAVEQRYIVA